MAQFILRLELRKRVDDTIRRKDFAASVSFVVAFLLWIITVYFIIDTYGEWINLSTPLNLLVLIGKLIVALYTYLI
ncbi:MAG: hypothetical protein QW478_03590 [Candidatus Micrarchaeaceae archaeon]